MSFIDEKKTGKVYAPGYFLAHEECVRKTKEMDQTDAETADNGGKYIPMGTVWPSNDEYAEGIVYEDVDVTTGNMPGSVVTKGVVYENRLPEALDSDAKTALIAVGFVFIEEEPEVVRPDFSGETGGTTGGTT